MRLLDPSRTAGARDDMPGATGWRRRVRGKRNDSAREAAAPAASRIRIVEILSDTAVSVRWSDPRFGHFGEQLWHCVTARTASRCVLTGAPIAGRSCIGRGARPHRSVQLGQDDPCRGSRTGLSASADGS